MRKIYFLLFTVFSFLSFNRDVNAQLANTYIYSSSAGATLDPMTGATTIVASDVDDAGSSVQNIGFTFNYEAVPYTQFSASPDGFLKLGTPAVADQFTNAIVSTTNTPKLFPYWDDVATGTTGSVNFVVTGTAPNRILVVQWFVTVPRNTTGAANSTMQAWLYETSGRIDFRYGAGVGPSADASIGINGVVPTNFISITSPANTSSTLTANNTNTVFPASGTMYIFLPPPPCVAPPGGGTVSGPAGTVCPGTPFTLTVTGASFGTGLTYEWQSSSDNSIWNPAGGTGAAFTTSISTNTYFRRKISCSGSDAFSTSVLVSATPPVSVLPWTENFDALPSVGATSFPSCWLKQNGDWRSANNASTGFDANARSAPNFIQTAWSASNEFIWTLGFQLTAGTSYDFSFWFADFTPGFDDWAAEVWYNTSASSTGATQLGTPFLTVGTVAPTAYTQVKRTFIPSVSGVYFFGIRVNETTAAPWWLNFDDFGLMLTPPCVDPTGLTTTAITPTTAALSWTASTSNPSNGYQWEVRASGAAGSGATGLAASGSTAAAVTTANATSLTSNTTYSYYVRADCGGTFSPWSTAFVFTTPCDPIATPFTETFASYTTTFPPTCWTRNNSTYLTGNAANAYVAGTGSSKFDFYNAAAGTNLDLVSPTFTPVPAGYRLVFDHAYATFAGEVDELQISYSTDGGNTYTSLVTYLGGTNGPLNTGGSSFGAFTPAPEGWTEKAVDLPVGTNRLRFRGASAFGNNLYLDNITVQPTPSCLPVVGVVTALAVSPTSVIVSFNSPGTGFLVEYGLAGFTPGTTNTPGAGGTIAATPSSPITIGGLIAGTAYDFYVRRVCIPGVDFSANKKATATTLCAATTIPYTQNFETATPLVGFPTCTSMEDVNGNSGPTPNGGGGRWITNNIAQTYVSPTRSLWYIYDLVNPARGGDDWFYLQGLNLTAGTTYRVKAYYKGSDAPTWFEKFEIKYGTLAHSSAMTNLIYSNPGTTTAVANPFDSLIADFTPSATGVYYIGFHNISDPDQAFLFIDDISVKVAPKVDVGVTGLTLPSLNCPASGVFVKAKVRNFNTVPLNFATYPVTVTATIAGAGTGSLTTILGADDGILAPGAEREVYLSPSFNFTTAGIYNINTTTISPDDPETGNDAYITSINVNPNPITPVITPSNAAICIGGQVQLKTQFTNPPPAPVTLPVVPSGPITVNVPDASAVGVTHAVNVTTVPVGATVTGVSVTINMTHSWDGDMVLNLKGPNNKVLNLFNRRGGSGDNMTDMVISSASAAPLTGGAPPFTGTFAADAAMGVGPTGSVSDVTTFPAVSTIGNGSWTLAMRDYAGGDLGILTSWSITITYQMLNPVVTWTPVAGLFTNSAGTTAYTLGTDAYSVYAQPAASTVYTATATNSAGCTATATATVTVNPLPVITVGNIPDTVCISDQVIQLPATPVGGSWSGIGTSGNTFIPPATAIGTYTLTYAYTSQFGCSGTATKSIAVKDCPERIIRLADNAVILYPNPNLGLFNIRINSVLYSYLGMKVYANNGVLVRTQQFSGLTYGRVIPIDMTNLPGGVYMVHFYYDGGIRSSEKAFKVIIGLP